MEMNCLKGKFYFICLFLCITALISGCSKNFNSLPEIKKNETTTNTNLCEITLNSVGFYDDIVMVDDVLESNSGNMKRLAYKVSIKNISDNTINVKDIVRINTTYGNDYSFNTTNFFHFSNNGDISPLEQSTGYVYIDVPTEIIENQDKIENKISIKNLEYAFKQNIKNYENYFNNMDSIYEKYDAYIQTNIEKTTQVNKDISDISQKINLLNPYTSNLKEQIKDYEPKLTALQEQLKQCGQEAIQYRENMISEWTSVIPPDDLKIAHEALIQHLTNSKDMYDEVINSNAVNIAESKEKHRLRAKELYDIFKESLYQLSYVQALTF